MSEHDEKEQGKGDGSGDDSEAADRRQQRNRDDEEGHSNGPDGSRTDRQHSLDGATAGVREHRSVDNRRRGRMEGDMLRSLMSERVIS